MPSESEDKLRNGPIILDTNVTTTDHDSINDNLYGGWSSLTHISEEIVASSTKRIVELEDLVDTGRLVVLREVLDEITAGYSRVDKSLKYFRNDVLKRYEDPQYKSILEQLHEYNFARLKFLKRISRSEFRIGFTDGRSHCDELNSIIKEEREKFIDTLNTEMNNAYIGITEGDFQSEMARPKPRDYDGNFKVDFNLYQGMLKLALSRFRDLKRKAIKKSFSIYHPGCQGLILDTDSKIVATGLALSYTSPVTILTRDKGVKELSERIVLAFGEPHVPVKYGLSTFPQEKLEVLDLDPHLKVEKAQEI